MSDFKITGPGFYRTRGGAKAEIVGRMSAPDHAGCSWLGTLTGWGPGTWSDCGTWNPTLEETVSDDDIIAPWTEPKKGTVWVNVYEGHCHGHTTRADADEGAGKSRLACISVNWTEGEGL